MNDRASAPEVIQVLTGAHAFAAARDINVNNYFGGHSGDGMAHPDEDELEDVAQDRFKERFGFRAKAPARKDVLQIKLDYNLSRLELRLAKMGGALRVRDDGAEVRPSNILVVVGWFETALLGGMFFLALAALIVRAPHSLNVVGELVAVAACSLVSSVLAYLCHVKANRLVAPGRRLKHLKQPNKFGLI